MQEFMAHYAVTAMEEHFFMQGDQPWVLFTLRYSAAVFLCSTDRGACARRGGTIGRGAL